MSHRSEIFVTPHDKAIRHRVHWTVVVTSIVLLAGCGGGGGATDSSDAPTDHAPQPTNRAPTISGSPDVTAIVVGEAFAFTPTASDPDGDDLTFNISNLPAWANFDSDTGTLSGTPAAADAGVYEAIEISVSDGALEASLSPFGLSVETQTPASLTLTWDSPTQNVDGSPLNDLVGYAIYYGESSGSYPNRIDIDDAAITSYTFDSLSPGTYYVVAIAKRSNGMESVFSNEVVVTVE
ncbi:MAG: putative Ig domain-containing protein [Pseudomonadota bacterium]